MICWSRSSTVWSSRWYFLFFPLPHYCVCLARVSYTKTKKYVLEHARFQCTQPGGLELGPLTKPWDPAECARKVESTKECKDSLIYWVKDTRCVCMQKGKGNEDCKKRTADKLSMVYKFIPGRLLSLPQKNTQNERNHLHVHRIGKGIQQILREEWRNPYKFWVHVERASNVQRERLQGVFPG